MDSGPTFIHLYTQNWHLESLFDLFDIRLTRADSCQAVLPQNPGGHACSYSKCEFWSWEDPLHLEQLSFKIEVKIVQNVRDRLFSLFDHYWIIIGSLFVLICWLFDQIIMNCFLRIIRPHIIWIICHYLTYLIIIWCLFDDYL